MIDKVLTLIQTMVDKYGTKFLVTLGCVGAIAYLAYVDKVEGWVAVIGIIVVAAGYYLARNVADINQSK